MLRASLRGLVAHRLRLALTALAVVLGVSLISGTYVLTDTGTASLRSIFAQSNAHIAVAVEGPARPGLQGLSSRLTVPASVASRIARVHGVAAVQGLVQGYAQFVAADGALIGGKNLAPTIGISTSTVPSLEQLVLRRGHYPRTSSEVAVDAATFASQGWHLGQRVRVATSQPTRYFTVAGVVTYGSTENLAGATLAAFDLPTAQRLMGFEGRYSIVYAAAAPGVSDTSLVRRVSAGVGRGYAVLTGSQLSNRLAETVNQPFSFLTTLLLVLAGISLFVGSFIIFNTFSITLAQRGRELGLLRCLGASRAQVISSVLAEAALLGLVSSVAGLAFGVLVALALRSLLAFFGTDLPSTAPQILPRTILVSLLAGMAVTLLASVLPVLRATRVPPVAALSDNPVVEVNQSTRRRVSVGSASALAGTTSLFLGLFLQRTNQAITVGLGAVLLFLGLATLSPLVVRPMARVIGWPLAHACGVAGALGRQNAMRNPRRTASTAAALMVGVALVSFIAVVASSARSSSLGQLDQSLRADYVLVPNGTFGGQPSTLPLSDQVVSRLERQPQLAVVSPVTFVTFLRGKLTHSGLAVDPATYPRVVNLGKVAGTLAGLGTGGIAVSSQNAAREHVRVGDKFPVVFAGHGKRTLTVRAVYGSGDNFGGYLLPARDLGLYYDDQRPTTIFVKAQPGVGAASSRAAVDRAVAPFPEVKVQDQAEVKSSQEQGIDEVVSLITALLLLAVLVALIGVTNTLALSVLERTRELGVLRAIGMALPQVRATVRWESVIISVLGTLPGVMIGVLLGWAMQASLESQGLVDLAVPVVRLAVYVVIAALAGFLAADFPARRAARTDMLSALAME